MTPIHVDDIDCTARIRYAWFVVPEQVIARPEEPNPSNPPILRLPLELLIKILNNVTRESSIYVAFTCKRLLKASSFIRIRRPYIEECSTRACNYENLHDNLHYEMAYFLRPLTPPGPWKFCQGCIKFRSRDNNRWLSFRDHLLHIHRVSPYGWDIMMGMWQRDYEPNCPECQSEELRRIDERREREALLRLVRMGYW